MTSRSLSEWLCYLETFQPHKIKLGLERVTQVAEKLGMLPFACPVIVVGGTNGKGSTTAFLESIYRAAGYRTGAYFSPHLFQFNERIQMQGQPVPDEWLTQAFQTIEIARTGMELTYFEFITLAAFRLFCTAQLDCVVLEVGLGGRLDAVNMVQPDVAVITSIGMDHTEWLGNDRDSIAREKAGIFRSHQPAVCGDSMPPEALFAVAHALQTPLHLMEREFSFQQCHGSWFWKSQTQTLEDLPTPRLPIENAATSLMVVELLQHKLPVPLTAIHIGLQEASLPGRFQKRGQCIYDVAHNPHAAAWLAQRLKQEAYQGRTFAVVGMLVDKDIVGTLSELRESVFFWYVGSIENNPRGAAAELICDNLAQLGLKQWYNCGTVAQAYAAALKACGPEDRVLVMGSFSTVASCLGTV